MEQVDLSATKVMRHKDLVVPFNLPIPGGMYPGKMVVVQGNIPSNSPRFAVNLITRSGDVALHICPMFKENRVVRNSILNMNWGPEESHGSMPVFQGQGYEIIILCESYSFKVSFNGRHFCDFSHRLPYNTISSVAMDGVASVNNLEFRNPNSYNNNEFPNALPYGFEPDPPKNNSGGLYPTIFPHTYPEAPNTRRSPSPSVPAYHPTAGGFTYPSPHAPQYPNMPYYSNPSGPGYPNSGRPGYPNSSGGAYPQNPSPYPTQPGYPSIPHQGPYPQVPNSNPSGGTSSSNSKPGFLDQAGAALAGVLGPSILAGGMNRNQGEYGRPSLLDEAGRALAGVIGGAGLSGTGKPEKDTQSQSTHQSGFLDQAGTALAGILGGAGLAGTARNEKGTQPQSPAQQSGFLDQAGTALAGILGGTGLAGGPGRSLRALTPPPSSRPTQQGSILDQAGSALAGLLAGGGLSGGSDNSLRGRTPPPPSRPTQQGSILEQAGSALAGFLGGGGLAGADHHNRKKAGILGGALGTAVAGAALTGHLNPVKATKKQLKAHKKALKYGLPIAGAGLGAYALHKGLKKGFRRSSSSSSCSSSD